MDSKLDAIEVQCWKSLALAIEDRDHPFKTAVLATLGARSRLFQRTVVLRGVDGDRRELIFHTDARAKKFQQIKTKPAVSLLFWDPSSRQQLSLQGVAEVTQRSKFADDQWHRTPVKSRTIYSVLTPPGTVTDGKARFLPRELSGINIDPAALQRGRPHFAVIKVRIDSVDWLQLKEREHRRASFVYDDDGSQKQARWIGA